MLREGENPYLHFLAVESFALLYKANVEEDGMNFGRRILLYQAFFEREWSGRGQGNSLSLG